MISLHWRSAIFFTFLHHSTGMEIPPLLTPPFHACCFWKERPVAAMFAIIMRINHFFRGSLFKRCFISQQPDFFEEGLPPQIEIFELLITQLVKEVRKKVFLIRYENLGNAIFGYKGFRDNHFYSVKWINIRNSLQRKRKIWDQLSPSRKKIR